ncbi:hypothetical protein [Flavicella sp.]|uniref:hypothetical protein n=1 Tax=Flavicella sp. TaxID=2957742 RepID=UPI00260B5492|nr:hypothetical protein [Flavicella sp.]MDG1806041.1 hypothetical protein [Flavicella sp.]
MGYKVKTVMRFAIVFVLLMSMGCSKEEVIGYEDLEDYIGLHRLDDENDVIACAASAKDDSGNTLVFFYPIPGATDYKFFETKDVTVDKDNLSLYTEIELPLEPVFNGYLQRFVRSSLIETYCIVTYKVNGELRTSQPIRLKQLTNPTEWTQEVAIDFSQNTNPEFSWNDGQIDENAIYFQVVTDAQNNLLSGTYTYEKLFTYYNLENVVLNVTRENPPSLLSNNSYSFTMMGVSLDNWVNLVIQKDFQIPN